MYIIVFVLYSQKYFWIFLKKSLKIFFYKYFWKYFKKHFCNISKNISENITKITSTCPDTGRATSVGGDFCVESKNMSLPKYDMVCVSCINCVSALKRIVLWLFSSFHFSSTKGVVGTYTSCLILFIMPPPSFGSY